MTWQLIKNLIFYPLLVSFFISFLTTPLVISIYHKLGWEEKPHRKKEGKRLNF